MEYFAPGCHPEGPWVSLYYVREQEPTTLRSGLIGTDVALSAEPGVRGSLTRDEVARLYLVHRDEMFRFALLVARDRSVAEDAVQEAFSRVYQAPERVRSPDRALAYIRSIVLNLIRTPPRPAGPSEDRFASTPSTEHSIVVLEDQAHVAAALDNLSVQQRACIVCRFYLDMSDLEVAETLDLSLGTAKTHMRRALRHLRRDLAVHHGA